MNRVHNALDAKVIVNRYRSNRHYRYDDSHQRKRDSTCAGSRQLIIHGKIMHHLAQWNEQPCGNGSQRHQHAYHEKFAGDKQHYCRAYEKSVNR